MSPARGDLHPALPPVQRLGVAVVVLTIVASVFNDTPALLPLGELSKEAIIYVVPLAALYLFYRPGQVQVPYALVALVGIFFACVAAGLVFNYEDIATAYFKGRSGISRVFTQGLSLAFVFIIALVFYNYAVRGYLRAISGAAALALLTMGAIGVLEMGSWVNLPLLTQAYDTLSLVLHADSLDYPFARLRATAFEASWAAVMLTFVFPFAIAGASRRTRPILLGLTIVLIAAAQSRTAMLAIGMQFMLLGFIYFRTRADRLVFLGAAASVAALTLFAVPGLEQRIGTRIANLIEYGSMSGAIDPDAGDVNVSNVTRLAAIRAGLDMFKERPVFGVGLGQYGFHYPRFIQAEDLQSWEVRSYISAIEDDHGWPPAYSLHVRLLAETGAVGYAVWLAMIVPLLVRSLRHASDRTLIGRMHLAVAMTLGGWLLLGVSIDSFRFFGGWIALGVAYGLPDAALAGERHAFGPSLRKDSTR
jgi:O-antigen ligase